MSLHNPAANKTLYSIDQRLERGFSALCCRIADANSDHEFVPVYEYITLYTSELTEDDGDGETYTPVIYAEDTIAKTITFSVGGNVFNTCDSFSEFLDPVQRQFEYKDSIGRTIYSTGGTTLIVDNSLFSSISITFQLKISRTSGFIQVFEGTYTLDASSELTAFTLNQIHSNSNISNQIGVQRQLIPTNYEMAVADIYAQFTNGVFVKYVDMAGADYTPTHCLSLNPVMPFTELNYIPVEGTYNTVEQIFLDGVNMVSPILAGTVHSISFMITNGTADVAIDSTLSIIPVTNNFVTLSSTTLLNSEVNIDASAGKAIVIINKP